MNAFVKNFIGASGRAQPGENPDHQSFYRPLTNQNISVLLSGMVKIQ
jgi:hypothetical protein